MTVPLTDALSVLAPNPYETRLLQACLGQDEVQRHAWLTDPGRDTPVNATRKILAPLLYCSLRERGLLPRDGLGSYLRAAALNEEVRWSEYTRISRAALQTLAGTGITPIVVGGAALAETVYPDPAARHSDSILLLVPDLRDAARQLEAQGFAPEPGPRSRETLLRHRSGLRLALRSELLASPIFQVPTTEVWVRSVVADVTGAPARRLSAADALLQVCVDGLVARNPRTAQWASDAWHVIVRSPDLSWDVIVDTARLAGAELPLVVALTYLADALAARVPQAPLETLGMAAARTNGAARDVCLYATRCPPLVPVPRLLAACRTWRSRALLIKWLLCPAPGALRLHEPTARYLPLPAAYAARLLRIALSRTRVATRRLETAMRAGSGTLDGLVTKARL